MKKKNRSESFFSCSPNSLREEINKINLDLGTLNENQTIGVCFSNLSNEEEISASTHGNRTPKEKELENKVVLTNNTLDILKGNLKKTILAKKLSEGSDPLERGEVEQSMDQPLKEMDTISFLRSFQLKRFTEAFLCNLPKSLSF
jgi:hypothetical protein